MSWNSLRMSAYILWVMAALGVVALVLAAFEGLVSLLPIVLFFTMVAVVLGVLFLRRANEAQALMREIITTALEEPPLSLEEGVTTGELTESECLIFLEWLEEDEDANTIE